MDVRHRVRMDWFEPCSPANPGNRTFFKQLLGFVILPDLFLDLVGRIRSLGRNLPIKEVFD